MSKSDHLGRYFEGVKKGDGATVFRSLSDSYVLDDPNTGQISKAEFEAYFAQFVDAVATLRGGQSDAQFMEISEIVTREEGGVLTVWCWWAVPGTDIQGSGLIKVGDDGVLSERLSYYTALPS